MKHTIYDFEINAIKEASDILFSPQEGQKMDDRSAYQLIHYTLEGIKERLY